MVKKKINKLKKSKSLTESSKKWLLRQMNDPFVIKAKKEGYRSRSTFKIIEIDEKFKIFRKGKIVLDLGAAPGGWSQIAVGRVGRGNVFALDILEMLPIDGATIVQQDFFEDGAKEKIIELLKTRRMDGKCDIILTDMAANTSGDARSDHLRIINLLEESLDLGIKLLNEKGCFVGKVFQGGSSDDIVKRLQKNFTTVKYFKPDSSRKESSECYLVATGFKSKIQNL